MHMLNKNNPMSKIRTYRMFRFLYILYIIVIIISGVLLFYATSCTSGSDTHETDGSNQIMIPSALAFQEKQISPSPNEEPVQVTVQTEGTAPYYTLFFKWQPRELLTYKTEIINQVIGKRSKAKNNDTINVNLVLDVLFQIIKIEDNGNAVFEASFDKPVLELEVNNRAQPIDEIALNDFKVVTMKGTINSKGKLLESNSEVPFENETLPVNINISEIMGQFFQLLPDQSVGENAEWTVTSHSTVQHLPELSQQHKHKIQHTSQEKIILDLTLHNKLITLDRVDNHIYATIEYSGELSIDGNHSQTPFDGHSKLKGVYLFGVDQGKLIQSSTAMETVITSGDDIIHQSQKMAATLTHFLPETLASETQEASQASTSPEIETPNPTEDTE